jgi:hypothetical protein
MSNFQFDQRRPRQQTNGTAGGSAANMDLDAIRAQLPADVDTLADELEALAADAEETRENTRCSCFLRGSKQTPCDAPRR